MSRGGLLLCGLDELPDPGSRGFSIERPVGALELFVVRRGGAVYGYHNRCPHTGGPLEWMPDRFLDLEGAFIECSMHGALFRCEDGRCLRGPCAGDSLEPVEVRVCGGQVLLYAPDLPGGAPART